MLIYFYINGDGVHYLFKHELSVLALIAGQFSPLVYYFSKKMFCNQSYPRLYDARVFRQEALFIHPLAVKSIYKLRFYTTSPTRTRVYTIISIGC